MNRLWQCKFWPVLLAINAFATQPCFSQKWPDGKRAAVSISYDDGYESQRVAASVLNDFGFRGTFYLAPSIFPDVQSHSDEWRQVFKAGNEVGNHSMRHFCAHESDGRDLKSKSWQDVAADVAASEEWLRLNVFGSKLTNHTYA